MSVSGGQLAQRAFLPVDGRMRASNLRRLFIGNGNAGEDSMAATSRVVGRATKRRHCRPCAGFGSIFLGALLASSIATANPIVSLLVTANTIPPPQTQRCGGVNEPVCPAGGLQIGGTSSSGGPDAASKSEQSALASAHVGGGDATAFYGLFASAFAQAGSQAGGARGLAGSSATWIDLLTVSASGVAPGTTGILHGVLVLDGSQTGSVFDIDQGRGNPSSFSSSITLNLDMGLSHFNAARNLIQFWDGGLDVQEFGGLHLGEPFQFAAQVVFGQQNSVRFLTSVNAGADVDNSGSAFSSADFSSTVYWGGIESLTLLDGTPVTNFTLFATSGFDYTVGHQVEGPPVGVPEPPVLALLLIGGAGLARLGHRRRRPVG
jgi:hypothetical protein